MTCMFTGDNQIKINVHCIDTVSWTCCKCLYYRYKSQLLFPHLNYLCMTALGRCMDRRPAIGILCAQAALCLGVQVPQGIEPALLGRKVDWRGTYHKTGTEEYNSMTVKSDGLTLIQTNS